MRPTARTPQELLSIADREETAEIFPGCIHLYTQEAFIKEYGSKIAEPNTDDENKAEINLLTAPYWWAELRGGSWIYPIHDAKDLQKYLARLL